MNTAVVFGQSDICSPADLAVFSVCERVCARLCVHVCAGKCTCECVCVCGGVLVAHTHQYYEWKGTETTDDSTRLFADQQHSGTVNKSECARESACARERESSSVHFHGCASYAEVKVVSGRLTDPGWFCLAEAGSAQTGFHC